MNTRDSATQQAYKEVVSDIIMNGPMIFLGSCTTKVVSQDYLDGIQAVINYLVSMGYDEQAASMLQRIFKENMLDSKTRHLIKE